MTVNTTDITSGPYLGNNTTDTYDYDFRITDESQLKISYVDNSGAFPVETILVEGTDYTVTGVGNDGGGTVVLVAGNLPTGDTLFIRSAYEPDQQTGFGSQGGFLPEVHESAIDKLTFLIQQLYDLNTRAFRVSDTDPDSSAILELPSAVERADKLIGFDADGNLEALTELGTWRYDWTTATDYAYRDMYKDPADDNVYFVLIAR